MTLEEEIRNVLRGLCRGLCGRPLHPFAHTTLKYC